MQQKRLNGIKQIKDVNNLLREKNQKLEQANNELQQKLNEKREQIKNLDDELKKLGINLSQSQIMYESQIQDQADKIGSLEDNLK